MGADSSNLTVGTMATVRDYIDGKLLSQIDNWHGGKAKIKTLKIQLYNYLGAMHPRMRELAEKASNFTRPILMTELTQGEQNWSRASRFALGQVFKGTALIDLETFNK